MNTKEHNSMVEFEYYEQFHDVALRILLVDDKIGSPEKVCVGRGALGAYHSIMDYDQCPIKVLECPANAYCAGLGCKLCTIKRLMDDGSQIKIDENKNPIKDGKSELFKKIDASSNRTDYFYWKEQKIQCFFCPSITKDFINDESVKLDCLEKSVKINFMPRIDAKNGVVQIVGVRDVRTALLLLGRYKFDMLFFDYLLEKKDSGSEDREYSIQFFEFLSTNYYEKAKNEDAKKQKYLLLDDLKQAVLDNRGPMDKFWIMPITGFNSPFITALQNRNVPLISYLWHIENGADPVTTPWQFLVRLNQFIELQLKRCIYTEEDLLTFIYYTGKNLDKMFPKEDRKQKCKFHVFQDFMGAEFSNFIGRYGARPVIRRDALIEKQTNSDEDEKSKSVFSTYIWHSFYSSRNQKDLGEKKELFSLHNLMQLFYQVAATMPEDRNGVMRLRESFRRLRYFIEIDGLNLKSKNSKIIESMIIIADCIDVLLVERGEKEDDKKGKK